MEANTDSRARSRALLPRRRALSLLAGSACAAIGVATRRAHAQGRQIRIGVTLDNSGVEKANGSGLFQGSSAYFAALNKAGGVHGVPVELVLADDQFKPDLAKANAQKFAADASVLAIVHPLGTRQTAAVMEAAPEMPIVGPNTGTTGLRKKQSPNTYWVRANYDQEVDKLVTTAMAQGFENIGLVHPNDPLGQSVLAAFNASLAKHKLQSGIVATTPNTTSSEVEPAALAIAKAAPQVVIMGLAGTAPAFVRALRKTGSQSNCYGLSITASAASIQELGALSRGLGFSIVVPSPFAAKFEIVRRYQADMAALGASDFSLPSLEGYIDARVLAEGLLRAGPGASRASLAAALERIEGFDLGGMRISYGRGNREGSHFVDVAVVGSNGKIIS